MTSVVSSGCLAEVFPIRACLNAHGGPTEFGVLRM